MLPVVTQSWPNPECTDSGRAGQASSDVLGVFRKHFTFRYPKDTGKLYDGSYGKGPYDDWDEWDDDRLSGYCAYPRTEQQQNGNVFIWSGARKK